MTYIYRVLRDGPSGVWSLDSLPLIDSSGYGNDATHTGSPVKTQPIVAGGIAAIHLEAGDAISYPVNNLMISGREARAFTLEAWIKPSGGNDTILAREASGLFLDGSRLRFAVDTFFVEYVGLKSGHVYHIVAVYDSMGIYLYVNGEKVVGIDIEPVVFTDTAPALITDTSSELVIDSVAVYPFALTNGQIVLHYEMGTDYPEVINLSTLNGGTYYEFIDQNAGTYRKTAFPDVAWSAGLFSEGLADVSGQLVNLYSETELQYQAGTWEYQEAFEVDPDVTIHGSRILWNATDDITVEMSEDGGVTWRPVANGGHIIGTRPLTSGYSVSIRVSIPESVERIVLDSLSIAFYSSMNILGSDEDLPATIVNPAVTTIAETSYPAASFNDNAGIRFEDSSGGLSIPGDIEFGGYFAVEMTVKTELGSTNGTVLHVATETAAPTITTDANGAWTFSNLTALYVDGVAVTSPVTIAPGLWHHVMAVFPESLASVFVGNAPDGLGGAPMRIGHLATYSDPVSASDAKAIYNAWVGAPSFRISGSNIIEIGDGEPRPTPMGLMAVSGTGTTREKIVVNWGSSGWKYLQVPLSDTTNRSGRAFDDSAWSSGASPFSDSGPGGAYNDGIANPSPLLPTATNWSDNTTMWVRRRVANSAGRRLNVLVRIDNYCDIYWNGDLVKSGGTPSWYTTVEVEIPGSKNFASNVLAVKASDQTRATSDNQTYLDIKVVRPVRTIRAYQHDWAIVSGG